MTDIQTWLDQGRTLADQAADHVGRLAAGDDKWTMTVPPKDTDSDVALMSLLDGRLPQALDALQAVLDMHHDDGDGLCNECSDGLLSNDPCPTVASYPCPTVRAIQTVIEKQNA